MKINMAKALQYATKFVSEDSARPMYCCAHTLDGRVMATDTMACISCDTGFTTQPNQMFPVGKGMKNLVSVTGQATDLISKVRPSKDSIIGSFKLYNEDGLGKVFKTWKSIFKLCADKCTDRKTGVGVALLSISKRGAFLYGSGTDMNGLEARICGAEQTEAPKDNAIAAMFATNYWDKICTVLADINPQEVTIGLFKSSGNADVTYITADDSVEIVLAGLRYSTSCPVAEYYDEKLSDYYESENR